MTSNKEKQFTNSASSHHQQQEISVPFKKAVLSFFYHVAVFDEGRKSLDQSDMIKSLLDVITWPDQDIECKARSVRIMDLLTNEETKIFKLRGGLKIIIDHIIKEIDYCCREDSLAIPTSSAREDEYHTGYYTSNTSFDSSPPFKSKDDSKNWVQSCLLEREVLLRSMLRLILKFVQKESGNYRNLMASLLVIMCNGKYFDTSVVGLAKRIYDHWLVENGWEKTENQILADILEEMQATRAENKIRYEEEKSDAKERKKEKSDAKEKKTDAKKVEKIEEDQRNTKNDIYLKNLNDYRILNENSSHFSVLCRVILGILICFLVCLLKHKEDVSTPFEIANLFLSLCSNAFSISDHFLQFIFCSLFYIDKY